MSSSPASGVSTSRRRHRRRLLGLPVVAVAAATSILLGALPASAAQPPVGLGTAESFAVLAGAGITNTGPTTITGDMGTFPTPSETGFGSITLTGTNHAGDAVTQGAKTDLVTAYNDAAGRLPVTSIPVELGGTTLLPGVYASGTLGLTGTLTLDGQNDPDAEFVFQTSSTLIAEAGSRIALINGANPCRIVWKVGSSATFKTSSSFVGDVLAQISITANTAATFQGRLLARDGAVTLDTNTITGASCTGPLGGGGTPTLGGGIPSSPGTPSATPPVPSATPPVPSATPPVPSSTPPTTNRLAFTGINPWLPIAGTLLVATGGMLLLAERRSLLRRDGVPAQR